MMVRTNKGLTLLEVIVAVTIFSIISLAVFGVFRSGTRSYQATNREIALAERARFAMDVLESDLGNLFYRDEDDYNGSARENMEEYQRLYLQAEETKSWDEFNKRYAPRGSSDANPEDPNWIGDPFERYRLIDLQFSGEDGGDFDHISFAIHQPLRVGGTTNFGGLSRVDWVVNNGVLVRSEQDVEVAPMDAAGNKREKRVHPEHMIVAEGVIAFNASYCFWVDHQWYEIDRWLSSDRIMRNSDYLLGEHEELEEDAGLSPTGSVVEGADRRDLLNESETEPTDGIPSYLRLGMKIADPTNPSRTLTFTRLIRLPGALETWQPNSILDEDGQEVEREERDISYRMIYPGAMAAKAYR